MNWLDILYDTYNHNIDEVGNLSGLGRTPLIPVNHAIQNTHITVWITKKGEFSHAVANNSSAEQKTIIPVTEKGAGRSGLAIFPLPLCDKLQYVASGSQYFSPPKEDKKDKYAKHKDASFEAYKNLLSDWVNSSPSAEILRPVLEYVKKGTLIDDLVRFGMLTLDNAGKIVSSKVKGFTSPESAQQICVRWGIEPDDFDLSRNRDLWLSWQEYISDHQAERGLCYIKGEVLPLATSHPRGIRNSGDKAKLISSNDKYGYTYRGRFSKPWQAYGVSSEVSLKAHSALAWLISNQGKVIGDSVILAWSPNSWPVPPPWESYREWEKTGKRLKRDEKKINSLIENFKSALSGRPNVVPTLDDDVSDSVYVMSLYAATTGRMALSSFQQFSTSDYLNNLVHWHRAASWESKKGLMWSPSVYEIASVVLGEKTKEEKKNQGKNNDKLKSQIVRRLLPCVLLGEKIPVDIEKRCIYQASKPFSSDTPADRKLYLNVACAVYKYNHIANNNLHEYGVMSLDTNNTDRSYLYGRLLAVAVEIENFALFLREAETGTDQKRLTNAERSMQRFQQRPYDTWLNIYNKLQPYCNYLKRKNIKRFICLDKRLVQITSLFRTVEDFASNTPLSGYYLLAYHCQRSEIYTQKSKESEETSEE
jgi:CRISPR-associated protein Csd1